MKIQHIGHGTPRRVKLFKIDIEALLKTLTTGCLIEITKGLPEGGVVIGTYLEAGIATVLVEHQSFPIVLYDRMPEKEVIEGISYMGPELDLYKRFLNTTLSHSE